MKTVFFSVTFFVIIGANTLAAADFPLPSWEILYQQMGAGLALYAGPFSSKKGLAKYVLECEKLMSTKCIALKHGRDPRRRTR